MNKYEGQPSLTGKPVIVVGNPNSYYATACAVSYFPDNPRRWRWHLMKSEMRLGLTIDDLRPLFDFSENMQTFFVTIKDISAKRMQRETIIKRCAHALRHPPKEKVSKLSEQSKRIIARYLEGYSTHQIGREFNITYQRVSQILRDNDIPRRWNGKPFTDDDLKKMAAMYESGMRLDDIADEFDLSRSTVRERLGWEGVKFRRGGVTRKHDDATVDAIKADYDQGNISINMLARKHGISRMIASKIANGIYKKR